MFARIESHPTYRIYTDGSIFNEKSGTQMKQFITGTGYLSVNLSHKGDRKCFKVHRLLAMCFIPCNCPFDKITVDHINRDKTDNRLENLRWANSSCQNLNRGMLINNTSGVKYIHFHNSTNRWRYKKQVEGKIRKTKCFKTFEEAVAFKVQQSDLGQ